MKKIGKYEFNSSVQADDMIAALGTTTTELGDVVPSHNHCVVRLGYIVLEQGEYNESGEQTKSPVLSDKYHVDVLWKGLEPVDAEAEVLSYVEPDGWSEYRIDLEDNGVHSFMGLDYKNYKF
jgi:hypothetical protein